MHGNTFIVAFSAPSGKLVVDESMTTKDGVAAWNAPKTMLLTSIGGDTLIRLNDENGTATTLSDGEQLLVECFEGDIYAEGSYTLEVIYSADRRCAK